MALQDPVAVYNAANNVEAQLLCNLLVDAGIEAFVTEDVSQVGVWLLGLIPEIHKPQVWVDRSNVEGAAPLIEEFDDRLIEQAGVDEVELPDETPDASSEHFCYHCGEPIAFGVSHCTACGKALDWSDKPTLDEMDTEERA